MGNKRLPAAVRLSTTKDIVVAHQVAEAELGEDIDVNYTGLPKNVGVKGDTRIFGCSVVISAPSAERLKEIYSDHDQLSRAANLICNSTDSACRVFLDLTPEAGYFGVRCE
jgi:GMP synthase PP-ATPase subunit